MCSLETVVTYSGIAWEPERGDKLQVRKGLPIDSNWLYYLWFVKLFIPRKIAKMDVKVMLIAVLLTVWTEGEIMGRVS